jgi:hypothetical protein
VENSGLDLSLGLTKTLDLIAVSAVQHALPPRSTDVRYWPLADMGSCTAHVCS